MADFKARPPSTFNPINSDFCSFADWRQDFTTFIQATSFFNNAVPYKTQQARLFNLAGADFSKFAHQNKAISKNTTITEILDAVERTLKPKRFDLQNRKKLFNFVQRPGIPAAKYLQELHELYKLWRTGFQRHPPSWSGIASSEAKHIIFRQEFDSLTLNCCLHLVSSFESVHSDATHSDLTSNVNISAVKTKSERNPSGAKCPGCRQQPQQHIRKYCPAFHLACRSCGKIGHFAKVCHQVVVNAIEANDDEEPTASFHVAEVATTTKCGLRSLSVSINGKCLSMLIDSGSNITLINVATARHINLRYKPPPKPPPRIIGANRRPIKMLGIVPNACIDMPQGYFRYCVGRRWFEYWSDFGSEQSCSIQVFNNSLWWQSTTINSSKYCLGGKFIIHHASFSLLFFKFRSVASTPLRTPSHRQNSSNRVFVSQEIKRLLNEGKIRPSCSS